MSLRPLLRIVDAITVPVPDLDQGLEFYRDGLGHELVWRDDERRQAGLRLPGSETEVVLSLDNTYEPNWLVDNVEHAVAVVVAAGGAVTVDPHDIPVGRLAVVADPFGNALVLLDLSKGRYTTDSTKRVTGVVPRH